MIYTKTMTFLQELLKDDIVIYVGKDIINIISEETRNAFGTLLVEDVELDFISVATGIAANTEKRIVLVCDDNYLLKHYSSLIQATVSRCNNLFFMLIVTKNYTYDMQQTNLFDSVSSVKGSVFALGFLTHIHTRFFKNKVMFKKLKQMYSNFVGPAVGIIEVNNNKQITHADRIENDVSLFMDFVRYIPEAEPIEPDPDSMTLVVKGE